MRRKTEPSPTDDVPKWFMTYSDVITLLMTFFILLLTFATNEPERFEKMKISLFGASGATGLAGEKPEGVDKDSWLVRVRPRSSRLTTRGAEFPPIDRDAPLESMDKGLKGLEDENRRQIVEVIHIVVPAHHFGSPQGELYEYGQKNMRMLASMLRRKSYEVTFEVSSQFQLPRALACMHFLFHDQQIGAERLAVVEDEQLNFNESNIRMVLRSYQSKTNVESQTEASQ